MLFTPEFKRLIRRLGEAAVGVHRCIPPSVLVAQALRESDMARAASAQAPFNNFYGIAVGQRPETYREYDSHSSASPDLSNLRQFASARRCMKRHAHLLASSERFYPALSSINPDARSRRDEWQLWLHYFAGCGYSSSPSYRDDLWEIITRFHLNEFDVAKKEKKSA